VENKATAEAQAVITLVAKAGKILLENGAETSRVENTVEYLGKSAGISVTCHATMTAIFVDCNERAQSHFVKVRTKDFNLQKVDEINSLSRQFSNQEIDFHTLQTEITKIERQVIDFSWPQKILGAGFVSVAPMLLFEAAWRDLCLAFFVGIIGYLVTYFAGKKVKTPYISVGIGGFTIGFLATVLVLLQLGESADSVIISSLMPLVPGVAMTNSLREIIGKHTISGMVRAIDAIMVAAAIGSGVIVGSVIAKFLLGGL
jgi:uncharacterized membrane protein YjjP (DUF1212 family)